MRKSILSASLLVALAAVGCGSTATPSPTPTTPPPLESTPTAEPAAAPAAGVTPTPEAAAAPTPEVVSTAVSLDIENFAHQSASVKTGTTVTWMNRDGVAHTTTGTGREWDSGALSTSQPHSFTFTKAGTYSYFCSIHTSMTGTITVQD